MIESDTPKTDAVRFEILSDLQSGRRYVVSVDFAMQLERELSEAKAALAHLGEALVRERIKKSPADTPGRRDWLSGVL